MKEIYEVKIDREGIESWYQNGKRHRLNGPAVIYPDGIKKWFQNGLLHRLDGPAVCWDGVIKQWWIR